MDGVLSEWASGKESVGKTKEAFLERENLGMVQTGLEGSVLSVCGTEQFSQKATQPLSDESWELYLLRALVNIG